MSIETVPDANGDGARDLGIASLRIGTGVKNTRRGRVVIVSAVDGTFLRGFSGTRNGDHFGISVYGDVVDDNGDGVPDILVSKTGAPNAYVPR